MKFNNKILLIVFVSLLALWMIVKYVTAPKTERTFQAELVQIDTLNVSSIFIYPANEKQKEIKLFKKDTSWFLQRGNLTVDPTSNVAKQLLAELIKIKPERLAAKSKEQWKDYQLLDSLATRVKVVEKTDGEEKVTLDVYIGKVSFQSAPGSNFGGQAMFRGNGGNVRGTSYIRVAGGEEVYAVEGMLPFVFNQGFNNWRNQVFLKTTKEDINKITFNYPADTGFVLFKKDKSWMMGDIKTDSAKTENYLALISAQNNSSFEDGFNPSGIPLYQITIEGNNMVPVQINGYAGKSSDEVIMHSSQNPKVYFMGKKGELFSNLFKQKGYFLMEAETKK